MEPDERWMLRLADARNTRDATILSADRTFHAVVVNAHAAGMTMRDICAATGLAQNTVRRWLHDAGRETDFRGRPPNPPT